MLSNYGMSTEHEKRLAAEAATKLIEPGMIIGLGTGSTVGFLLPILARRKLSVRCVASSPRIEKLARDLGLQVESFNQLPRLDLSIDGADQITLEGWLNKGRGAAHTREKIIAAASDRFVIIADCTKLVSALHGPVPLELLSFGLSATLQRLEPTTVRSISPSPDGGVIADYQGPVSDPRALAAWLESVPGVIEHGLFPPELVTEAWIARGDSVERLEFNTAMRSVRTSA